MNERKALQSVITTRIELEEEAAALAAKLPSDRRELERLTRVAQTYHDELESIQGSGLKGLFLRITGRQEERVEQAQRQAAKAKAEAGSVQFRVDTAENRIAAIEKSLMETQSKEAEFHQLIRQHFPNDPALISAQNESTQFSEAFAKREKIQEEMSVLLQLVDQAIRTHTYGDMQTSATGTRYNRRAHTLKEHCLLVEEQLATFCMAISAYNELVPEDLRDELEGPWTGNDAYLTEPLSDPELLSRLIGLQDWTQRIKRGWKKSNSILKSNQRQANNRLRYLLLSLYDQMN